MTDQDIIIAMAEVEGWRGFENSGEFLLGVPPDNEITRSYNGGKDRDVTNWTARESVPSYLTDANACLRVLEKESRWETNFVRDDEWGARSYCVEVRGFKVLAPTFCRAACEAVLRAHGKWREA